MASPFVTGERDVPLSQWTVDGNAGHVCFFINCASITEVDLIQYKSF